MVQMKIGMSDTDNRIVTTLADPELEEEITGPWETMETLPQDGTPFDLLTLFHGEDVAIVNIARDMRWARYPIGNKWGITGSQNMLADCIKRLGWRRPKNWQSTKGDITS